MLSENEFSQDMPENLNGQAYVEKFGDKAKETVRRFLIVCSDMSTAITGIERTFNKCYFVINSQFGSDEERRLNISFFPVKNLAGIIVDVSVFYKVSRMIKKALRIAKSEEEAEKIIKELMIGREYCNIKVSFEIIGDREYHFAELDYSDHIDSESYIRIREIVSKKYRKKAA
jgi:hypothetical protein